MRLPIFLLFALTAATASAGVKLTDCDCWIFPRTALESTAGAGASAAVLMRIKLP